jgi:hypothetical protein
MTDRVVAVGQGVLYVVTGVWPLVSLRSFERVTGPKVDGWLVKTVGVVVACVGAVLLAAARRDRVTPEITLLGVSTAASLTAIDVVYVSRRRISPIYLADALAELMLIAGWVLAWRRRAPTRGFD